MTDAELEEIEKRGNTTLACADVPRLVTEIRALHDQLVWADRLVRHLAALSCEKPVEITHGDFENCGEVFVCGGICPPCSARKYTDRYPAQEKATSEGSKP